MLNHSTLQGRFTKQPETKFTPNGVAVCSFTIAWSERYKERETQCFLNCVTYRNTAEFVGKYFNKGDQAVVEGKLTTRSYDDTKGNKKYVTELIVDKVHFCGSKKEETNQTDGIFEDVSGDEDLPF